MPHRLPPASVNRAVTAFIHISKEPRRRLAQPNDVGQCFFRSRLRGGERPVLPLGGGGASGTKERAGRVASREAERSEEHTSELQSLMRISYAVFCLKKKKHNAIRTVSSTQTTNKTT